MGLKTTNYEVKKLGITLPEAYAIIDKIDNEKNSVSVTFGIYAKREGQEKLQPIEIKKIHFVWDRKSDIAVTAYEIAKGQQLVEHEDPETGKIETTTVNGILYGWEDDYLMVE
ncbi:MAG: hypothetical protein IJX91_04645 [Clostridia bacterium]|nr:hypothetical protein [Clostridia bacterium]